MADPTREQFDAAAKKVMETAPPGLSREAFFDLIQKEIEASSYHPDNSMVTRALAREADPLFDFTHRQTPQSDAPPHEPDTWWGGFGKSIKDQLTDATVKNPVMIGAAHPTSVGDLLPFMMPATIGTGDMSLPTLVKGMKRTVVAGGKAAADGPALSSPLRFVRGAYSEATKPTDVVAKFDRYLPNSSSSVGGDFGPSAEGFGEEGRPIIDRYMPNLSSGEGTATAAARERIPYGAPNPTGPSMTPGQVMGKAPTLEDSLTNALTELLAEGRAGEPPRMATSHPSTVETAGEGALRQSGKFGKSGSKGQPGGYSSGRPAINPASDARWDELVGKFGGRGEPSPASISAPEGGGAPSAPETTAGDWSAAPAQLSERAHELRSRVGSREAARQMFGSASKANVQKIIDLTPGYKGGTIPTEAQDRIMDALMNQMMEDPKK